MARWAGCGAQGQGWRGLGGESAEMVRRYEAGRREQRAARLAIQARAPCPLAVLAGRATPACVKRLCALRIPVLF